MATATQPMKSANPVAATYDQGNDIQPGVSWSNPNKDSYPAATTIKQTTTTTTTTATTGAAGGMSSLSSASPRSTSAALEKNLNPLDKEDPRLETKALPFGAVDSAELAATVHTEDSEQQQSSSYTHPGFDHEHNGNILDRTMDQIRTWVHSFNADKQGSHSYSQEDKHSTLDSAKQTYNQYTAAAANQVHAASDAISRQAGQLQQQVGNVAATVSDKAQATAGQVKQQVNQFIQEHQGQAQQLTSQVRDQLPSADQVKAQVSQQVSSIVPPLAQQASTSYAFLGSFLSQYLSTYRDFVLAMRRQSLPLQAMTALLFVTHFVLPWFFPDKAAARSVISCFVVSSILSHLTYFLSGHLRYTFLAHLVFVPMLLSLTLHAGFNEAGQVSNFSNKVDQGENMHAAVLAPFSLRSYTFILWLRLVLMVQASLFTLDAVNVLDLLGFSLETRRGQEMTLINRSVQQMRRNFAHSVAPQDSQSGSSSGQRQQGQQGQQGQGQEQQSHVVVQSEEQQGGNDSGLRSRKSTTSSSKQSSSSSSSKQQPQQQHVHPKVYVNEERVE